jgi:hypothetical protein
LGYRGADSICPGKALEMESSTTKSKDAVAIFMSNLINHNGKSASEVKTVFETIAFAALLQ